MNHAKLETYYRIFDASIVPVCAGGCARLTEALAARLGRKVTDTASRSWGAPQRPLVHFGAVVADAPSPLSTPRCATGQAQLPLGKPLRMKCRASPVLLFMRTGRVVAGTVGIVRATVPFHGEHDAQEPTKVKRGQGGGRASALAPEL